MDDGVEASKVHIPDIPDIHPQPRPITGSIPEGALSEEFAIETDDVVVLGPQHRHQHRSDVTFVTRYQDIHRNGLAPLAAGFGPARGMHRGAEGNKRGRRGLDEPLLRVRHSAWLQ